MGPHDSRADLEKKLPLVSVIIPAYNAQRFIGETIKSVLYQSYTNLEILIIDDGSKDKTAEIVREYMLEDKRIKLIQQANAGVAAARNHGIEKSTGQFIAPLDADDIWYPENIRSQVGHFLSVGNEVGLVYAWSIDIDEDGRTTGCTHVSRIEGKVHTTLLLHYFIANSSCVLVRRSCFERVIGYDTQLRKQHGQGCEDWDLLLRIAEQYEFRVVPRVLVGYRRLSSSMSKDCSQMARSHELIWEKTYYHYPRIPTLVEKVSSSSFYLYLASQDTSDSNNHENLKWAYKALRHAPVPTLLNPGFYRITLTALLKRSLQPLSARLGSSYDVRSRNTNKFHVVEALRKSPAQRTWGVKPAGELVLHFLASLLIGPADQWL